MFHHCWCLNPRYFTIFGGKLKNNSTDPKKAILGYFGIVNLTFPIISEGEQASVEKKWPSFGGEILPGIPKVDLRNTVARSPNNSSGVTRSMQRCTWGTPSKMGIFQAPWRSTGTYNSLPGLPLKIRWKLNFSGLTPSKMGFQPTMGL